MRPAGLGMYIEDGEDDIKNLTKMKKMNCSEGFYLIKSAEVRQTRAGNYSPLSSRMRPANRR